MEGLADGCLEEAGGALVGGKAGRSRSRSVQEIAEA